MALAIAGCGGGSGDAPPTTTARGSIETKFIASRSNGTTYPLYIYWPPNSSSDRASLPVVYLLDGESRFATLVGLVEALAKRVIIVAIGNELSRAHDYVPSNSCTPTGGGEGAFFDFIRLELIPFVDTNVGGDATRRALLGHSHGGSFVLYALFNEPAGGHHFSAYLASDASISCMPTTASGWESSYAAGNGALPVRLHISFAANVANASYGQQIDSRHYSGLTLVTQAYAGDHISMIPAAFSDAVQFAFPPL
jgi:predicted alpha/beta superfamily hydrolase